MSTVRHVLPLLAGRFLRRAAFLALSAASSCWVASSDSSRSAFGPASVPCDCDRIRRFSCRSSFSYMVQAADMRWQ